MVKNRYPLPLILGLLNQLGLSDRGPEFVSKFWRSLFEILKMDIKLFSAFHLQNRWSDEACQIVNQVLEQYLRCTINY
jgi:hypothetical protein